METYSLVCHPDTPAKSVQSVKVQIVRHAHGHLAATYVAASQAGSITIPASVAQAGRTDGLWNTTCFEVFVRRDDGEGYYEFNFAPSTCWAGYSLTNYRSGMVDAPLDPPDINVAPDPHCLTMSVTADLSPLTGLPPHASWTIAISAIIEEADGTKSYWALAHPPGEPDFHDPACFTALVPAPDNT